jgi:acyl-CoA synthetase (NDP forming)
VEAAGISTAAVTLAATEDEAVAAAGNIGYPVALKAAGPEILHKTDIGGVILDLGDAGAVRAAFRALASRVGTAMTAAIVQQMVPSGVEMLVGAVTDPTFGPLVACGSGGVLVDLLQDTAFRLHPLTDVDAGDMVNGLRSVPLLRGYRGQAPTDESALVEVLLRVSALLEIGPELQELDINPLKVLTRGARAVDVRARVGRQQAALPSRRIAYY